MKVAICFYGFLRQWRQTIPHWRSLFNAHDTNVFIHTWDTEQYKDRELGSFPYGNTADPLDISGVTSSFNPTDILVESYKEKHPEILSITDWVYKERDKFIALHPEHSNLVENRVTSNYSMWYSWGKALELKRKHEIGFVYDVVLLVRSDFILSTIFDFSSVTQVVTPPWPDLEQNSTTQPWVNYDEGICDRWLYGPSKMMDMVGSMYANIVLFRELLLVRYDFERVINPHKIPAFWMKVNNIDYIKATTQNGLQIR